MTDTPISDAAMINSEPHGNEVVPYSVAQELERGLAASQAKLLSVALKCPDCDDIGYSVRGNNTEGWEQEQCQFCYTEPLSRFNLLGTDISALDAIRQQDKDKIAELEKLVRWYDSVLLEKLDDAGELERKLAELQAAIKLACSAFDKTATEFRSGYLSGGSVEVSDLRVEAWKVLASCGTEELTKLISEAEQRAREAEREESWKQFVFQDYELYYDVVKESDCWVLIAKENHAKPMPPDDCKQGEKE